MPKNFDDLYEEFGKTIRTDGMYGGWHGCKSKKKLWGAELAKAIRTDMREWLGDMFGIKKSHVNVRSHTYTGGQSIDVTIKVPRDAICTAEEFTAAMMDEPNHGIDNYGWINSGKYGGMDGDVAMTRDDFDDIALHHWLNMYDHYVKNGVRAVFFRHRSDEVCNLLDGGFPIFDIICAATTIYNAYNHDCSDSQTDYFDRGFYGEITVKFA